MTISLTKEQENELQKLIQSGQFDSPEAFMNYSLASLEADAEHDAWMKADERL